jgi:hypothetical protein
MPVEMTPEVAARLREPFAAEHIGKLPRIFCNKCRDERGKVCEKHRLIRCDGCNNRITTAHLHLDYVGHAEVTSRLLTVDPGWAWEPVAWNQDGLPLLDGMGGMWIRLTIAGVTRLGYGDASGKKGTDAIKETIGDAIRNAALRFGVAVDLWGAKYAPPAEGAADPEPVEGRPAEVDLKTTANNIRDWALKSGRTADELDAANRRLHAEHPDAAGILVVNEHGDDERLANFLARRARETDPAPPEPDTAPGEPAMVTEQQHRHMHALWRELGYDGDTNRDKRLDIMSRMVGRELTTSKELTEAEADQVIAKQRAKKQQREVSQ